jgi:hypothetical protein
MRGYTTLLDCTGPLPPRKPENQKTPKNTKQKSPMNKHIRNWLASFPPVSAIEKANNTKIENKRSI